MRVISLLIACILVGCFESAPPSSDDVGWVPADSYLAKPDTLGPSDTGTSEVSTPGLPCTTDLQCEAIPQTDKCLGPFRCIDWECQADPSQGVACPPAAESCQENSCNPQTGVCELSMKETCICKPSGNIACGQYREFSTSDPGTTNVLGDYPCGPSIGTSAERVWIYEAQKSGSVKVALNSNEFGGVWVIGYDGNQCLTASCVAGGKTGAAFQAQEGFKYAIVIEQPEATAAFARLTAYCDLTEEVDCSDGLDDNFDGKIDCADPSCANKDACPSNLETDCSDGIDNDGDGKLDCGDEDCDQDDWCNEICIVDFQAECGFNDSRVSAEYGSDVTNYTCGPEAGGYDVIYRFTSNTATQVAVTLKSDVASMGLYGLIDGGKGCKPSSCFLYNKKELVFPNEIGQVTYVVVDAAKNSGGYYEVDFVCNN